MKTLTALFAALASCAVLTAAAQQPAPPASEKWPASSARLNLNAATAADLAKLPGIGEARAKAIIKGRPYKSKEELVSKKILPADVYEEVKGNLYAWR